ncbi:MAG: UDP-N-acetylmuramoyl-tripeptide--D-alanyl-D-alanine ligase [Clostridia bacterium]|jgi:UDP-N-acetylmuramoyl-tripeptide--D-alanyl-D-alanine ligase|nr:UDP-N-acetylmuramoyl-tripeptide--D-alanyl-D-alanine ligase [Clostridia bacterium]
MDLHLQDIVKALDGDCLCPGIHGEVHVQFIHTDSRQMTKGSLFIPLKGEKFDGHEFIPTVFDKGAIATLTEERSIRDSRLYTIYVKDTREALLKLANFYRNLFDIPVIGVTGSVGKTSTKEIIAAVLSAKYNVHKTEGNFNNEIGLPLTLFKLQKEHDVAVVEMGMNHFGEIHNLSIAANPQIAVITNIGTSHIEHLGSREGILKAKLEILDGLGKDGLLIVNGDNDLLSGAHTEPIQTIKYGLLEDHPYYAKNIIGEKNSTTADIFTPKDVYPITISALGEHMIYNTLAAVAIAESLGLSKNEILRGLASYQPTKMRMNIQTYDNGFTVIDDTYNASTDSMCAALKVLQDYPVSSRKVAVLGDMLELGDHAALLHEEVGKFAGSVQIDLICAVGPLAKYIYDGAKETCSPKKVIYYEKQEAFIKNIKDILHLGDTVLFKASRGMHFEEMVEAVRKVKRDE